jgi:hypothetical protein
MAADTTARVVTHPSIAPKHRSRDVLRRGQPFEAFVLPPGDDPETALHDRCSSPDHIHTHAGIASGGRYRELHFRHYFIYSDSHLAAVIYRHWLIAAATANNDVRKEDNHRA